MELPISISESSSARPILVRGERLGLALMTPADVPLLARWNQDLAFTAHIGSPGEAHSLETRQDFYAKHARMRSDNVEFSVILLSTGAAVGFGGLSDMSRNAMGTLFVGIGERDLWGRGLGTEATRLICEYGFFYRSLHGIKVEVNGYNTRAVEMYRRLGFRDAGRLRDAILLNGRRYDQYLLDLLRNEMELKFTNDAMVLADGARSSGARVD